MSWFDNLRLGSFVSPSQTEHFFKFDNLSRSKSKKASISEILESDESIAQDQGNNSDSIPMNIYFVGEFYDELADAFWAALSEKYTPENPGVLKHPRWGDIDVMPITFTQSENFVSGSGVGRFTVEFRKTFPRQFPTTDVQTEEVALGNIDEMSVVSAGITDEMKLDNPSAVANMGGQLSSVVGTIVNSLKALVELQEGLISQFEAVQQTINTAIDDVAGNIVNIIAGVQFLMRMPGRILTGTLAKINGYADMIDELINGIDDPNETNLDNQINNAILLELVAGMASGALAEAAVFTNYTTRSEGAQAIDLISEKYIDVTTALNNAGIQGLMNNTYVGDHDYLSLLQDTITRINYVLLNKSFDLKVEKIKTLKESSDIITLCWDFYKDLSSSSLDFFILTNNIIGDEFIELPPGREIVFYG